MASSLLPKAEAFGGRLSKDLKNLLFGHFGTSPSRS